ncbi:hypothetical protein K474DRAFT_1672306 [Panus rudis PR-1116 ss-1]|nr:hypothetical protein K474DRAFT_1672306 [Panus rudis PR-1116 ss-1]
MGSPLHLSESFSNVPISLSPAQFSPGGYPNQIHSLEQDFCSNFSCCGLCLASMHQLLDHFEENHVVVLGKDGRPIYPASNPEDTSTTTTSDRKHDGPRTSIVVSYPQPHPPLQPESGPGLSEGIGADAIVTFQNEHLSRPNRFFSDVMADFDPFEWETSASSSPSPSSSGWTSSTTSSAMSSPEPSEPMCLPPSLLTIPSSHVVNTNATTEDQDHEMIDVGGPSVSASVSTSTIPSRPISSKTVPITPVPVTPLPRNHAVNPVNPINNHHQQQTMTVRKPVQTGRPPKPRVYDVNGRKARIIDGQAVQRRRDREKAYKCPHPGCSKQYLNPNGLKYHLEKGTCDIDPSYVPPEALQAQVA